MNHFAQPVTITIEGVRVYSEANKRDGHWGVRARRARGQADIVRAALVGLDRQAMKACPRLRVTFQRVMGKRGRAFDSDNLTGSMKVCRDVVARWIGVDDGDPWWDWVVNPEQVRGMDYGIRIRFEPLAAG